ncbi:hypothetical protein [Sphingomonas sp. TZW2008]|uniref:hypothetical protein n=1 Tax=Sphingomonas sp. TZW2008 TaxID=1917973 RepID=UPI000A26B056|nr:hypothetical protein [Sphingomonas sp. TZW2008]
MAAAKAKLRPKNEAPRRSGKTMRGTPVFSINSDIADSLTNSRLQVLASRYGLRGRLALTISAAFWGEIGADHA